VEPCDVASDSDIANLFARIKEVWGTFDILIQAVAFAKKMNQWRLP
jgi:enoyl-[acyl-carrier-protein] reductase (NADH)